MSIVTRFAPSPTGYLHLGHAFSALFAWRRARESGGRFLLRLEDIDPARCRPQFADAILEDLAWLGLDWDGEVRVQSEHLSEYRTVLDALRARGLLYPCFCSRADIQLSATAPQTPDGAPLYPGTCRALSEDQCSARIAAGERYALRLNMQRALASNTPLPQAGEVGEQSEPGEGLPLTFEDGTSWSSLGLKGDEKVTLRGLVGDLKPRQKLTAEIVSGDGSLRRVSLLCRIDTLDELEYYRNGGILHYVLRKLAA